MRIQMIETLSSHRESFIAGREYDAPEAEALQAIRAGIAKAVLTSASHAVAPTPAETPKRTKKNVDRNQTSKPAVSNLCPDAGPATA